MGKDLLAGEPFRLTVGSPVPVAAPEHTHTQASEWYTPCSCCKYSTYNTGDCGQVLTGSAGVTAFGRDISELLNQGAEEFSGLQSVLAGALSAAGVWCNV